MGSVAETQAESIVRELAQKRKLKAVIKQLGNHSPAAIKKARSTFAANMANDEIPLVLVPGRLLITDRQVYGSSLKCSVPLWTIRIVHVEKPKAVDRLLGAGGKKALLVNGQVVCKHDRNVQFIADALRELARAQQQQFRANGAPDSTNTSRKLGVRAAEPCAQHPQLAAAAIIAGRGIEDAVSMLISDGADEEAARQMVEDMHRIFRCRSNSNPILSFIHVLLVLLGVGVVLMYLRPGALLSSLIVCVGVGVASLLSKGSMGTAGLLETWRKRSKHGAPSVDDKGDERPSSDQKCPTCGEPLRAIQVETMIGNPEYEPWCRGGFCSLTCYQKSQNLGAVIPIPAVVDPNMKAMIVRATAPDNLDPSAAQRVMDLGPEAVPSLIDVLEHPRQPGNVGGAASDQGVLAVALLKHARSGNEPATAFLREIAQGKVQLYDFGGKRAYGLAQDFVREEQGGSDQEMKSPLEETEHGEDAGSLFAPGHLDTVRKSLTGGIKGLSIVNEQLPSKFWNPCPIETITGINATIDAVMAKLKQEGRLIEQYVANVESLTASVRKGDWLDGVTEPKPHDHVTIIMSRDFRNGGSDLIVHHVFRTGREEYKFAYMNL